MLFSSIFKRQICSQSRNPLLLLIALLFPQKTRFCVQDCFAPYNFWPSAWESLQGFQYVGINQSDYIYAFPYLFLCIAFITADKAEIHSHNLTVRITIMLPSATASSYYLLFWQWYNFMVKQCQAITFYTDVVKSNINRRLSLTLLINYALLHK